MPLCKYGCGQEGKYQLKSNPKDWICESSSNKCPVNKLKNSIGGKKNYKYRPAWNKGMTGIMMGWEKFSKEDTEKIRERSNATLKNNYKY